MSEVAEPKKLVIIDGADQIALRGLVAQVLEIIENSAMEPANKELFVAYYIDDMGRTALQAKFGKAGGSIDQIIFRTIRMLREKLDPATLEEVLH